MKKRGQIWVETVIYTLIVLTMIGLVLSFVLPRVLELQDQTILERSKDMIMEIDNVLLSISRGGVGNRRSIDLNIRKGDLIIDGEKNIITFIMESSYIYSEPGQIITDGRIKIYTEKIGEIGITNFTINYEEDYNMTYNGELRKTTFSQATIPYQLLVSNEGYHVDSKQNPCPTYPPQHYTCEEDVDEWGTISRFKEIRPTIDFRLS